MFGAIWLKLALKGALTAAGAALAGLGFMLLASASIQYDEIVAPKMSRLVGSLDAVADAGRRLLSPQH